MLGRNVRDARLKLGISQEELAFRADMKRSYVSDLARGTRQSKHQGRGAARNGPRG